jgi:hypothetical protein
MKILTLIPVVLLTGCALILPRDHDPVMFGYLVETKIAVDKLSCEDKEINWNWISAETTVEKLKVYTTLRNDPQAEAIVKLEEALKKAKDSTNKVFCESVLKINKTRIDVIVDAWKGR